MNATDIATPGERAARLRSPQPRATHTPEELKLAAWFCWAVPLLATALCIQRRHLRAAPAGISRAAAPQTRG